MPTLKLADLQSALSLTKRAVASQDFIKVLTCFYFNRDRVIAYNDKNAITVKLETGIHAAVPGDLLLRMVGTLFGDDVNVSLRGEQFIASAGSTNVKLAVEKFDKFPYEEPAPGGTKIKVTEDFLSGLEKCLLSVNEDPSRPGEMGVVLQSDKHTSFLFSTDNATMSRYELKEVYGSTKALLPTFFCEGLLDLAKAYKDAPITIYLLEGAVYATVGDFASVFSKQPVNKYGHDFNSAIKRFTPPSLESELVMIPPMFDPSLTRAHILLSGKSVGEVQLTVEDSKVTMLTQTPAGVVKDELEFKDHKGEAQFFISPSLVLRSMKYAVRVYLSEAAVVVVDSGSRWLHLIRTKTDTKNT